MRTSRVSLPSIALLVAGLLLVGCKPAAQAGDVAPPATTASPAATPAPAPVAAAVPAVAAVAPAASIDAGFREGMPYATLRKRLTDAGWLPLRDPQCWKNAGPGSIVCGLLPEVESCSGDGYCNMHFANGDTGQRIAITTYGPYDRWNQPGQESALAVKSWETTPPPAPAAAACPAQAFDAFLKAFAADPATERAFTAPLVKVAELGGGADGTDTVLVYEDGARYRDFNVVYAGDAFHYVDADGVQDASPLTLDIQAQGDDVRVVRYRYGMSEGNAYTFERRDGCWALTQDPEPPSP